MNPFEIECDVCKRRFDERSTTMWNRVVGWEKKRDAGGTNYVALRRPEAIYRCDFCMMKLLAGDAAGQELLFDRDVVTGARR